MDPSRTQAEEHLQTAGGGNGPHSMLIALESAEVEGAGVVRGRLLGVLYGDLRALQSRAGVCAGVFGATLSRMDCKVWKSPTGCKLEPENVAIS